MEYGKIQELCCKYKLYPHLRVFLFAVLQTVNLFFIISALFFSNTIFELHIGFLLLHKG